MFYNTLIWLHWCASGSNRCDVAPLAVLSNLPGTSCLSSPSVYSPGYGLYLPSLLCIEFVLLVPEKQRTENQVGSHYCTITLYVGPGWPRLALRTLVQLGPHWCSHSLFMAWIWMVPFLVPLVSPIACSGELWLLISRSWNWWLVSAWCIIGDGDTKGQNKFINKQAELVPTYLHGMAKLSTYQTSCVSQMHSSSRCQEWWVERQVPAGGAKDSMHVRWHL